MKPITERSTKKELLEAYQALQKQGGDAPHLSEEVTGKGEKGEEDKASGLVANSKRKDFSLRNKLNTMRQLQEVINSAISDFEEEAALFLKQIAEEKEAFKRERDREQETWKREKEAYAYQLKMERRKEEDEYDWGMKEKERKHQESFSEKERELEERRQRMAAEEDEIEVLRKQAARFPEELKKAVQEAENKARKEAEGSARSKQELTAKDTERERELAKLKLQSAEDVIKRQGNYIATLERQLSQAGQKVQELAVSVISSRAAALEKTQTSSGKTTDNA